MERFTEIKPVIVEGYPNAHTLWLKVNNQSFVISAGFPDFHETKEEAEWARDMLCIALDSMAQETKR